ncbi:MAG: FliH/SctL family protein [Planctomycetota bacterium]|jgi:flagellar assembly protein FliH
MLEVRSIPIPASRRVKADSSALPTAALLSDTSFEALVRRTGDTLQEELRASAQERAHTEAVRRACGALERAGEELVAAREAAEAALASDAVHLAVEIARQLLRVEIAEQNYGLEEIVRSTLAASEIKRGRCVVRLHPDDVAALQGVTFRDETEIQADVEVEPGAVVLETPKGLLVREPEAVLDDIREQLLQDIAR